jgi:hypothetical protein
MKMNIKPEVPLPKVFSLFLCIAGDSYTPVFLKYGVDMLDGSALIYVTL